MTARRDFPYYSGDPVWLTGGGWALVLAAVVVAFFVLILGPAVFGSALAGFIPVVLYVGLPLAALAIASRGHWKALFGPVGGRDVLLMVAFAILNFIVTLVVGSVLIRITETTSNAATTSLAAQSALGIAVFYVRAAVQILGEELMTLLPFLALMALCVNRLGTGRRTAIVVATVLTAVLFAAAHLPTYGWNIVQALGGVGVARIILTLPYILTRNIWVSTGAHVLNDWITFSISLLGAAVQTSH